MFPALENNAAAGFKGPAKIELLKGASLLTLCKCRAYDLTLFLSIPTLRHLKDLKDHQLYLD